VRPQWRASQPHGEKVLIKEDVDRLLALGDALASVILASNAHHHPRPCLCEPCVARVLLAPLLARIWTLKRQKTPGSTVSTA
jgi:hypothetical protein